MTSPVNEVHSLSEQHVTPPCTTCVTHNRLGDRRAPCWPQSDFLDGVECDAASWSRWLDARKDCFHDRTDAKVSFHSAHEWYFSPVDSAIGQDRRKRGLGAFIITIEPDLPLYQGVFKVQCFGHQ